MVESKCVTHYLLLFEVARSEPRMQPILEAVACGMAIVSHEHHHMLSINGHTVDCRKGIAFLISFTYTLCYGLSSNKIY